MPVLNIRANSRSLNFSTDEQHNHSNCAKRAAGHDDKKSQIGWAFWFSHFFVLTTARQVGGRLINLPRIRSASVDDLAALPPDIRQSLRL
jgi:hypothetical protein